jgi:hypothetical protein
MSDARPHKQGINALALAPLFRTGWRWKRDDGHKDVSNEWPVLHQLLPKPLNANRALRLLGALFL